MKVKDLIEKIKDYEDYDIEVFSDVVYKDNALGTEEKQTEIGNLVYFDKSLTEQKIIFKFKTCVDLTYNDLA